MLAGLVEVARHCEPSGHGAPGTAEENHRDIAIPAGQEIRRLEAFVLLTRGGEHADASTRLEIRNHLEKVAPLLHGVGVAVTAGNSDSPAVVIENIVAGGVEYMCHFPPIALARRSRRL